MRQCGVLRHLLRLFLRFYKILLLVLFQLSTPIKIGRKRIMATISLTDRGGMKYPVLIGRKLLTNRFLVNVSQVNLLEKKVK